MAIQYAALVMVNLISLVTELSLINCRLPSFSSLLPSYMHTIDTELLANHLNN